MIAVTAFVITAYPAYYRLSGLYILEEQLFSQEFNKEQINAVCDQAIVSFGQDEYHNISKKILEHYINDVEIDIVCFIKILKHILCGKARQLECVCNKKPPKVQRCAFRRVIM